MMSHDDLDHELATFYALGEAEVIQLPDRLAPQLQAAPSEAERRDILNHATQAVWTRLAAWVCERHPGLRQRFEVAALLMSL
jgi:hypothetical protein